MTIISRIKNVDIREVWKNEAQDFTPWLLKNSDVLGEALGMDLEIHEAEHTVGNFSLDLIGTDSSTDEKVIIENQLERSDHTHLGQLLTYAGGTDPVNIVWIADKFRDEHRAALDWLNERTDESTRFFGVEINAIQIDDSRIAPQFNIVASPNDWQKEVRGSTAAGLSKRQEGYVHFWTKFLEEKKRREISWIARESPARRPYMVLSSGSPKVKLVAAIHQESAKVELYFGSGTQEENAQNLNLLRAHAGVFEEVLGQPLSWEELPHAKAARVAIYKPANFKDVESWDKEITWMLENLNKFHTAIEELGGMVELLSGE